jgi:hypothetical protein
MRKVLVVAICMVIGALGMFALGAYMGTPQSTHRVCVLTETGELVDCVPAQPTTVVTCQEDMPCFDGSPKDSRVKG